jgi:hypothetical protein
MTWSLCGCPGWRPRRPPETRRTAHGCRTPRHCTNLQCEIRSAQLRMVHLVGLEEDADDLTSYGEIVIQHQHVRGGINDRTSQCGRLSLSQERACKRRHQPSGQQRGSEVRHASSGAAGCAPGVLPGASKTRSPLAGGCWPRSDHRSARHDSILRYDDQSLAQVEVGPVVVLRLAIG